MLDPPDRRLAALLLRRHRRDSESIRPGLTARQRRARLTAVSGPSRLEAAKEGLAQVRGNRAGLRLTGGSQAPARASMARISAARRRSSGVDPSVGNWAVPTAELAAFTASARRRAVTKACDASVSGKYQTNRPGP